MTTDFFQAAKRMGQDAEKLYETERLGTADHLYGLASECALKAILVQAGVINDPSKVEPRFKVHIDKIWDEYQNTVCGRTAVLLPAPNPFSDWHINHRYTEDGFFTQQRVISHREGWITTATVLEQTRLNGST